MAAPHAAEEVRRAAAPDSSRLNACFHCGLPVIAPGRHCFTLLGAERELCCAGCEAVARTIAEAGLESYYETRTGFAAAPPERPAPRAALGTGASEAALILDRVRCAACLWLIEQRLARLPGVARAQVNYATQRAHVAWDAATTGLAAIIDAVRAIGYDAYPYEPRRQDAMERRNRRLELWRLFVAGFGAMQVMMYAFPAYIDGGALEADTEGLMRWASLLLTAPVLVFACGPFFSGACQELRLGRIGLDAPIALGLALGFAGSAWATVSGGGEVYFDCISMIAFLLLGARAMEAAARRRAARALDPLLRWDEARGLAVGDEVQVAPGERVPADGVVLTGVSSADESLLTGESRPVPKGSGAELVGGSINLEQPLLMRVTRVGADTRAAAIARLVERGAASKPRAVAGAERVARHLTWIIVVTAAAAGLASGNPWIALAVLVVACPCALGLAAPTVLTRASAVLLGRGVLLTRAGALEALERATDVVLDKTGTLTTGRLAVRGVHRLGGDSAEACMALAASLEAASRHPIARAFGGAVHEVQAPRQAPGEGLEGTIGGRRLRIGTAAFCRALSGAAAPAEPADGEATRVYLADEHGFLAAFDLEDELRPEARALVEALERRALRVHLASGDAPRVVAAMAKRVGIDRHTGGMRPQDKFDYVERLQAAGRTVVMIGDGLNDAPVLARADASLALGSGADAAQLNADIVLAGASLEGVLTTLRVARRAMRLVRQNIGWALAYNAIALPLAAIGAIGPWEAALAMGTSSLIVLLNALRPLERATPWKASTSSFPSPSPSYS